jgi:hypothetical protein
LALVIKIQNVKPPADFNNSARDISELHDTLVLRLAELGYTVPEEGGYFTVEITD